MKNIFLFSFVLFVFCCSTACKEDCGSDINPVCQETVPNEDCLAVFSGWFYNSETTTCTEIGYSGCTQKGFQTKEDCEACKCCIGPV